MFQTNEVTVFLVLRRHHSDLVSTTLPSIHRHSSFQNWETRQTRISQRHTTGKHIATNLSFQWPLPHFATIWVRFCARFFGVKTHRNAEKPWSNRSNRLRQGTHNRRRSEIQVVNLASRRSEPWIFQSIQSIHIYPTYPNSNLPISKVSGDMPDKTMKHLRPKSSMSKIKNFASVGNMEESGMCHIEYIDFPKEWQFLNTGEIIEIIPCFWRYSDLPLANLRCKNQAVGSSNSLVVLDLTLQNDAHRKHHEHSR